MNQGSNLNVAVLGAGLIGLDLVTKIKRSRFLDCQLVVARDEQNRGLRSAAAMGCRTTGGGVTSLAADPVNFDVVFDASNAASHAAHWEYLETLGALVIDLTPSRIGHMIAPTVNGTDALVHRNVSLISCGGQTAIPVLHALTQRYSPSYIEVVTTAASMSVGRASRLNLDEYVQTTQAAIRAFTGVPDVKVLLNLSPAEPPPTFRVAISLIGDDFDPDVIRKHVTAVAEEVRTFAAGFEITACSVVDGKAFIAIEVEASGDLIPSHAGNLDIINSAAIFVAEQYAAARLVTEERTVS
ncbi:acetaldehyde dehydrogenase (acetylating) [Micromonospora sp. DR5-3]|uniref:acetylating acetaldehyde dehydrogenase n=1 Tax=unclassified Micromonospora TaxID=2617518 RepID=UPI0011D9BCF2|nr:MULTISPECIES: acetaldehyde dehydrogenase (acetylating) [unclassified Micromonospora]MCW3818954.1 acetaldehyde dehydrogenase (acetylating) [Micromonospora sp. DR5-3]TYC21464.1 acetaldehyde dehydrogenase (acetylating) [Micromonospora sp. MP36]